MRKALSLALVVTVCLLAGCNTTGPRAIRSARLGYNEAITQSWNEQLLLNLVRLKYRDTPLFLEVDTIATQYHMAYSAAATPAISHVHNRSKAIAGAITRTTGRVSDKDVEVDTGVSFYEQPTITYSPLQGQKFVTQILTPIPFDALMLLSQSGWSLERILGICVQRMNGLKNAPSASGPTPSYAPCRKEFARAAALLRQLQVDGAIDAYAVEAGEDRAYALCLSEEAADLKALLGLPPGTNEFLFSDALNRPGGVTVQTRSLLGVLHFLANAVEVPEEHQEAGWVTRTTRKDGTPFDWSEVTGGFLRVQSQEHRPADAFVAVRYRGSWFYIGESDLNSKSTFGFLSYLFYLQAGEIKRSGPVQTLSLGG